MMRGSAVTASKRPGRPPTGRPRRASISATLPPDLIEWAKRRPANLSRVIEEALRRMRADEEVAR